MTWEAAERVNCSGIVTIVPVTAGGELLLIRQFRPVVNNYVVEFPAGLNDREESLEEAAKRELVEETGYTSDNFIYLSEGPISSGLSAEILSVFLAMPAVPASPEMKGLYPPDESEDIEVIRIPFAAPHAPLEELRKNGDLVDLKIYGLLELAKRKMESSRL